VISIDMAQAVMRRDPSTEYTLERGSGMVGARTMARRPDRITTPPHRPNQRLLFDVKPNRTHTNLHRHIIGLQ
jgi:hypothetical protein